MGRIGLFKISYKSQTVYYIDYINYYSKIKENSDVKLELNVKKCLLIRFNKINVEDFVVITYFKMYKTYRAYCKDIKKMTLLYKSWKFKVIKDINK